MDRRTDKAVYKDARTHLEEGIEEKRRKARSKDFKFKWSAKKKIEVRNGLLK